MTRNECENKITEKLIEIAEIYNKYNPQDEYLSMVIKGKHISANNSFFQENHEGGIIDLFVYDYKEDKEVYHYDH